MAIYIQMDMDVESNRSNVDRLHNSFDIQPILYALEIKRFVPTDSYPIFSGQNHRITMECKQ